MKTKQDILKEIKVEQYFFGISGIEIDYSKKVAGRTEIHRVLANPEQAADMLKRNGMIEDYSGAGNEVTVEVEFVDEPSAIYYWLDFVFLFTLSQHDALEMAANIEFDKEIEEDMEKISQLPSLVARIIHSYKK